jgi:hypothetical protein
MATTSNTEQHCTTFVTSTVARTTPNGHSAAFRRKPCESNRTVHKSETPMSDNHRGGTVDQRAQLERHDRRCYSAEMRHPWIQQRLNAVTYDQTPSASTHGCLNRPSHSQLYPFPSKRFHVLLNSLFKVLCNFPSRYLFAIGFAVIFSLR